MIKKKIEDQELLQHLDGLPEDGRQVSLLADGQIRLTGLGGTTMVNQMRANFNLGLLETYILGQAYIAAGLMASSVKGNDRIQLNIDCGGPIGGIYVESWACGAVRGFIKNNPIPLDKPVESKDISLLYGPGFISVTKLLEGNSTPFTGQTMMQYGDLAKDLALYYNESEQTPTMFSLGIHFDKAGRVIGAGGLFLQTKDRSAGGGLAAAGFAHEAEGLAALDLEADAVHGFDVAHRTLDKARLNGEPLYEVLDLKQVLVICGGCFLDFFHLTVPPHSQTWDTP